MPITFDETDVTFDELITFDTSGISSGASMSSVSARRFANSIPGVLQAGGSALGMNAVFLTQTTAVPIGALLKFGSQLGVAGFFGSASLEAKLASIYFAGFNGATQIPSAMYFAQYNTTAVAGYLRGAALTNVSLTTLQGLSGTITVAIDGTSHTSAAINLASAASYSAAAALIQTGLQAGTPSTTATVTYDSTRNAFVITSSTTGSSSSVGFATTGTLASGLLLTQAAGAVLSPGAAAATPSGVMTPLTTVSQDWATFTHTFDPDNGAAGGPIKQAFAVWNAGEGDYYMYVPFDSDPLPSTEGTDAACFAQQVQDLDGVFPIWSATQGPQNAAFVCGLVAAIDFTAVNGRTSFAGRSSPALTPDVSNDTIYGNITSNGYNCYAQIATRSAQFQWLQRGVVTGGWSWADTYVNQIYWNAKFQNDFMTFMGQVKFIPYNQAGYAATRQAISPDITSMGQFGAWVPGVVLSGTEIVAVNNAAGANVAPVLQTQGWYLLVQDPGPDVRQERGSPIVKFFYCDGGSIQEIDMSSTAVE